jgi:hypothetical protein
MNVDLRRARFDRECAEAVKVAGGDVIGLENFLDRWRELKGLDDRKAEQMFRVAS